MIHLFHPKISVSFFKKILCIFNFFIRPLMIILSRIILLYSIKIQKYWNIKAYVIAKYTLEQIWDLEFTSLKLEDNAKVNCKNLVIWVLMSIYFTQTIRRETSTHGYYANRVANQKVFRPNENGRMLLHWMFTETFPVYVDDYMIQCDVKHKHFL